ncbi:MAG: site-specific integrase [Acidimicrobiia bacterium]
MLTPYGNLHQQKGIPALVVCLHDPERSHGLDPHDQPLRITACLHQPINCGTPVHLAAMTGMRRGEVLGLRWGDVHFQAKTLAVRHTIISVAYEVRESTPKSHQARVIDLDAATVDLLRSQAIRQETERHEWGPGYQENDLVFRREDGSPVHPESLSDAFETEVERSGLPRIRLHDLRHGHATIALRAGVPVKVVSERLGHENPAFTLKQYAHVMPGMQAEAAALVASLVNPPAA